MKGQSLLSLDQSLDQGQVLSRQAVTRGSQQRADRQYSPWIEEWMAKEKLPAIQRKNQLERTPKACLNSD